MNKLRPFISLIIATVFLFFFATPSLAVTKTSGNLEATFDEPIFSPSDIWYPGFSLTRDLIVKNKGSGTETVIIDSQNETETGNISQVFSFRAGEGGSTIYEDSLADFWTAGEMTLSDLSGGQSKTYKLTAGMDSTAGNEYQGKEAIFDLLVGFLGKPTAVTFVAGPAGPPVCTDAKSGIPTGFTAVARPGTGEVILSWTPPSPSYTYFLIAYSDTSAWPPKWGNPDVGNVSTYTVSGLGTGTYYFWLRAGNGCMPGDFVGPISPGAITGVAGAPAVAPGFLPGVLGAKEKVEEKPTQEVKAASCLDKNYIWWLPLAIQLIVGIATLEFFRKKQRKIVKRLLIIILGLAIISQAVHEWLGCNCATSVWCPRYWVFNLLVLIISLLFWRFLRKRKLV